MENSKRKYVYRERPYNYNENLIRENSRKRKIRKQLTFTSNDLKQIEEKILEYQFADFSNYIRYCIINKEISNEDINIHIKADDIKENRKQICFSDEEMEIIKLRMQKINCNNFNLFITTLALK